MNDICNFFNTIDVKNLYMFCVDSSVNMEMYEKSMYGVGIEAFKINDYTNKNVYFVYSNEYDSTDIINFFVSMFKDIKIDSTFVDISNEECSFIINYIENVYKIDNVLSKRIEHIDVFFGSYRERCYYLSIGSLFQKDSSNLFERNRKRTKRLEDVYPELI